MNGGTKIRPTDVLGFALRNPSRRKRLIFVDGWGEARNPALLVGLNPTYP